MHVVENKDSQSYSLPATPVKLKDLKVAGSELAQKILQCITETPKYPADIAKELNVHEQKVYYHIRNLQKAGLISVIKKETKKGGTASYYGLSQPAAVVTFKELEKSAKIAPQQESNYLSPFIKNGVLNATIVVGSPDPHGPDKARSRDGYFAIDFALFLGTYLGYVPKFTVKLDTHMRDHDYDENLIMIGGPITNKSMEIFNNDLPIKFIDNNIHSTVSGTTYTDNEVGFVVNMANPQNKDKSILIVAGKGFSGTRAAIISFLKHYDRLQKGNANNKNVLASVVEGIDLDSDGVVDDVEFKE